MRVRRILLCGALLLAGCGGGGGGGDDGGGDGSGGDAVVPTGDQGGAQGGGQSASWFRPALGASWQWQLLGTVNTGYAVDIYDIDLFDSPTELITQLQQAGRRVICYFSAGSYEAWRPDAAAFAEAAKGKPLEGFADERWLDIRSADVAAIMRSRLDLAVQKGCDGVEPDNVDGFANDTGFALSGAQQLDYNRMLADEAHQRGLAVGLKNDLDQVAQLVDGFDFAVNEQCFEFNECEALMPFVAQQKPVLNAEYLQRYVDDAAARTALCEASRGAQFSTLVLPLDLDDSFRFSCEAPA